MRNRIDLNYHHFSGANLLRNFGVFLNIHRDLLGIHFWRVPASVSSPCFFSSEWHPRMFRFKVGVCVKLDGGFKYVLFSPRTLGMIPILANIFQLGWFNHQLVNYFHYLFLPAKKTYIKIRSYMSFWKYQGTNKIDPTLFLSTIAPGCEWIWDHQKLPSLPCGKVPGEFPLANGDQVGMVFCSRFDW